ncbi:tyrosine-type recombinase/integrase [Bacillus sp. 31A1R]|uniref:Tyrosine-type recombinase/integrase n=1 Tax=Robertmurraya mangrovi TaxID=3098077 RepID=A0ABU5IZT5_9BACI|nr:tyrosine-type recombinase/integrase [Bacillus sp. 31A1R]MDZ5472673.1 tyrosine-type recombinase/integrase [Bacillus sp. 31A1R]
MEAFQIEIQQALDDFLLYLEVEQNYSQNTLDSYESDLSIFLAFLQHHKRSTDLDDLNPSIVRRFIQHQTVHGSISPRSMQRRISSLKSFCQFCLKEKMAQSDFTAGIIAPKADKKLPKYLNLQELKQLFVSLEQAEGPLSLRNETMFKLLGTTGMRKQELVSLTWEQIDLYNETIKILGKGKKERLLPLHSSVVPLLKALKQSLQEHQTHPLEPVFRNGHGRAFDPRGVNFIFKGVLQKAGLPPHRFTLHHLRHTFATLLLQQGHTEKVDEHGNIISITQEKVDLRTLQELLGHESLATTQMYTHIDYEAKKKAIDSFHI